jgi:cation-transporting ATPase E
MPVRTQISGGLRLMVTKQENYGNVDHQTLRRAKVNILICGGLLGIVVALGALKPVRLVSGLPSDELRNTRQGETGIEQKPVGLSASEVIERRSRGLGNDVKLRPSRTYFQVLKDNVFTFLNAVPFAIGLVLLWLEQYTDALTSVWVIAFNTLVGLVQEVRAKRKLDKISLLTRPRAAILRDDKVLDLDPAEIVVGDILVLGAGDQVVVDGQVLSNGPLEVDESLLTGESNLVPKKQGDPVYSGSYCVTGGGMYQTQKVGLESFANRLTSSARLYRRVLTPLQRELNQVLRLVIVIAAYFGCLLGITAMLNHLPLVQTIQMAAVIAALVPNGLFMMITLAYGLGAVRLAGRGALIQQANAVESLSNVDVLCLDKTGTLTANRLKVAGVYPIGLSQAEFKRILGNFAASASSRNRTSQALLEDFGGQPAAVVEEVAFSSERKWSALSLKSGNLPGVYVLGAVEMLAPAVVLDRRLEEKIAGWQAQGLRVLLFAGSPSQISLHDFTGQPRLPEKLTPLGLVSLGDELRPKVEKTIQAFAAAGVALKIISGDNPQTVLSLARQAGIVTGERLLTGLEIEKMSDPELALAAEEVTIFGRITPQQKERLVEVLQNRGHYVAMIGDGVNDVLSLKKANLGIAMESGSQATRAVADIILLGDSFEALPLAFKEGQRIRNGMMANLKLHLPRIGFEALLIISMAVAGLGFPFLPRQSSIIVFLTVGIPVLGLTIWAEPGVTKNGSLFRVVLPFILPAILTRVVLGLGVFLAYYVVNIWTIKAQNPAWPEAALEAQAFPIARTALFIVSVLSGLLLVLFVKPPSLAVTGGRNLARTLRPAGMALVIVVVFGAALAFPFVQDFLELSALSVIDFLLLAGVVGLWGCLIQAWWRGHWSERILQVTPP